MSTENSSVIKALKFRHATKLFKKDQPITDKDWDTIVKAAQLSPTSFGLEPFEIIMLESPETRELFRDFTWGANGSFQGTKGQIGTAPKFGIITAYNEKRMRHDAAYLANFLREVKGFDDAGVEAYQGILKNFQLNEFHLESDKALTNWSGKQAYIVLANMMTAAADLKIDSCPVEGFDMDKTAAVLQDKLGVDMSYQQPAVMFAFGYRADDPSTARTRRDISSFVRTV